MADDVKDTGWKSIIPQAEVVDTKTGQDLGAYGAVEMVHGLEDRPCCMCKHWDHVDVNRVIRHLLSKGLTPREDGKFDTPIAKDFPGRVSMVLDPKNFGYCKTDTIITEMTATCDKWSPTISLTDFQQRMKR
ncbi:MAG TPA: hypothetical protein VGY48_15350 [Vicinamibacterales bacterium]|jgi:hypothetical protein|nr:hypothetical protein [Vicinamibacterales bacterium]